RDVRLPLVQVDESGGLPVLLLGRQHPELHPWLLRRLRLERRWGRLLRRRWGWRRGRRPLSRAPDPGSLRVRGRPTRATLPSATIAAPPGALDERTHIMGELIGL